MAKNDRKLYQLKLFSEYCRCEGELMEESRYYWYGSMTDCDLTVNERCEYCDKPYKDKDYDELTIKVIY